MSLRKVIKKERQEAAEAAHNHVMNYVVLFGLLVFIAGGFSFVAYEAIRLWQAVPLYTIAVAVVLFFFSWWMLIKLP